MEHLQGVAEIGRYGILTRWCRERCGGLPQGRSMVIRALWAGCIFAASFIHGNNFGRGRREACLMYYAHFLYLSSLFPIRFHDIILFL
ncbi:hypothetical protein QBC35DRAFT_102801 [Podospora australis]|uniref:Uncharacterized protein n=1 Tax=Podospora australis TaxID=1536484 RepID=A0AAN6X5L3_9PEZI|nr:hypothetical protein QBC35DRAFT_102801 [Podospora australis]